jgi:hypothetical protein
MNGGRQMLALVQVNKQIQQESGKNACQVQRGMAIALLICPQQGYCTGVFIGACVPIALKQGHLCPREPKVSSKYSPKGRLQIVITEKAITDEARNTLIPAGPVTVGRIPLGLPDPMRA